MPGDPDTNSIRKLIGNSGFTRVMLLLSERRLLTFVITSALFTLTVLPHDTVQTVLVLAQGRLGPELYGGLITAAMILAAVGGTIVVVQHILKRENASAKTLYWLITMLLICTAYNVLVAVNSEAVHLFQYALLALPLYAFTSRYGETITAVALLGTIDEGYQYWILHRHWAVYLDFNDIVLNILGGGLGLLFIWVFLDPRMLLLKPIKARLLRGSPRIAQLAIAILAVALGLLYFDLLRLYPENGSTTALNVLSRSPAPDTFWITAEWANKSFHILTPVQGLVTVLLLLFFFSSIDHPARKRLLYLQRHL